MSSAREIELSVGRRSLDGIVRLTAHPPQLMQLSVSYKGERSSSVVLTRSQTEALQYALADFVALLSTEEECPPQWDLAERRTSGALNKLTA
jgi:hypothetical protein